jgi:phosphatidylserine/phosphatidylglycerophosphate/cardiolipin synthase-like enzyme
MRDLVLAALLAAVAFGAGFAYPHGGEEACAESVEVLISPGIEDELLSLLESANESIAVELYQFSHQPLRDALVEARGRGVQVRVILEPRLSGDDNVETAEFLASRGVAVRWASLSFANTHSKFAVVDEKVAEIGSPNWSYSAMFRNREAAVIVEGEAAVEIARVFEKDWEAGSPA